MSQRDTSPGVERSPTQVPRMMTEDDLEEEEEEEESYGLDGEYEEVTAEDEAFEGYEVDGDDELGDGDVLETYHFASLDDVNMDELPATDEDGNPLVYEFYDANGQRVELPGTHGSPNTHTGQFADAEEAGSPMSDGVSQSEAAKVLGPLREERQRKEAELAALSDTEDLAHELDRLIEEYPLNSRNPAHYGKLWWWLFTNPDAVRLHRMKKRKGTLKWVGAWVASTMLWLPTFIYSFYLVVSPSLKPRLLTDALTFLGIPYLIPTNRLSQQLLILAAWLLGGVTGMWKGIGRRKSLFVGTLSAVVALIVTDVLIGTLTEQLVWRIVASVLYAVLVGITFGLARVVKCDGAVVYTLLVGIAQCFVCLATGIYDSPGGEEFMVALTACCLFTAIGALFMLITFPRSWKPVREIFTYFLFAFSWMVCFYYAAKSAKGNLIWSFILATTGVALVLFMFYRGLRAFFHKFEVDHRIRLPKEVKEQVPSDDESTDEEADAEAKKAAEEEDESSEDEDERIKRRLRSAQFLLRRRQRQQGDNAT